MKEYLSNWIAINYKAPVFQRDLIESNVIIWHVNKLKCRTAKNNINHLKQVDLNELEI